MRYVDKLLQETNFLQQLEKLEQLEQNREFCKHGMEHLLDTARIAWIRCLETKEKLEKEDIYLATLLHDLGRVQEYEAGVPHHQTGAQIAEKLLQEIGYPQEKISLLVKAIGNHRNSVMVRSGEEENSLAELLYWADKKSRNCFCCKAQEGCKWSEEKRNHTITY